MASWCPLTQRAVKLERSPTETVSVEVVYPVPPSQGGRRRLQSRAGAVRGTDVSWEGGESEQETKETDW